METTTETLQSELDNKASADHTHDYAASSHTHTVSQIEDISTTYSAKDHTHESSSITDFKASIVDLVYPVGSIYTSMDPTSPSERFGGTRTQIVDRFLNCASSSVTTGGSSTITEANLPSHNHTFSGANVTDNLLSRRNASPSNSDYTYNIIRTWGDCNPVFSISDVSGESGQYIMHYNQRATSWDVINFNYTPEGTLSSTGDGQEFMPPYMTMYCWQRTA